MTPSEKQQEHSFAADAKQKLLLSLHPFDTIYLWINCICLNIQDVIELSMPI